jgi:Recombination enhancement, RecA-dependent nuclease
MGPSKAPTKAEREWMARARDYGCLACLQDGHQSPASIHHLVQGNRRLGHLFSIPLCEPHHKGDGRVVPSVHFQKRTFVARYGAELELLAGLQVALGVYDRVTAA